MRSAAFLFGLLVGALGAPAQDLPPGLPQLRYHLTARPWQPLRVSRTDYLDAIEGVCRFSVRHQDERGAIIDPFLHREHQYSTPYFAVAVGALVHLGRAPDLLENGIRAMDHATACFAQGDAGIPDAHGEFFLASLPAALELYANHVSADKLQSWRERLRTTRSLVVRGGVNNWRTYAMRGEWRRAGLGLADRPSALAFIEEGWLHATQRDRMVTDKWNLYQDHTSDPESLAVEAVGRANLLSLAAQGYDGPSSAEIRSCAERGTAVSLLLQDPSGQCPPNGRTDDHVFNDVLYQLCIEIMAERAQSQGDSLQAGAFRHAAMLSFRSIERWRRSEPGWAGSYYVTKNHFDPARRIGYQPASQYGNYNGAVMLHLAEACLVRQTEMTEQPAPVEIGGYAFALDGKFATAVANAGGMQMVAALRGSTAKVYDQYWTALGVERFGRVNWDTRLGPSDGARDTQSKRGVTFAPTWVEEGVWVRMADHPERYRGQFRVEFVHPLLVRCAIDYTPLEGAGPSFRHEFLLTPDGVLATLCSTNVQECGVTCPLLENDGAPLRTRLGERLATTAYANESDEQCFLALDAKAPALVTNEPPVQSSYGWLRPIRAPAADGLNHTFVFPRNAADPPAEAVRASFRLTPDGYESVLGCVHGTLYVGRTSAGGEGASIDSDGDGKADVTFATRCGFILQLRAGKILAIETDRKTTAQIGGRQLQLEAYAPVRLATPNPAPAR